MKIKILVVDDNQAILDSLSALLLAQGYTVDTACHGLDGSEKLQASCYDLVLIDHLMPIMNGIQLTKHVRQHERHRSTPVIFMTTQGRKAVESVCNTELFSALVDKPLDEEALLKLINNLLSPNTRPELL